MRILNLEDDMLKHVEIDRCLKSLGAVELEHVKTLSDGKAQIEKAIAAGKPYELLISDMYYPLDADGVETNSGTKLIEWLKEKKIDIPVIVCSSVRLNIPEIVGTVHYSAKTDWEWELLQLIKDSKIMK